MKTIKILSHVGIFVLLYLIAAIASDASSLKLSDFDMFYRFCLAASILANIIFIFTQKDDIFDELRLDVFMIMGAYYFIMWFTHADPNPFNWTEIVKSFITPSLGFALFIYMLSFKTWDS